MTRRSYSASVWLCMLGLACASAPHPTDADTDARESDEASDSDSQETDRGQSALDLLNECLGDFPANEYAIADSLDPEGVETAPFLHGGTIRVDATRIEVRFVRDGRTHRLVYTRMPPDDWRLLPGRWCDP